MDELRVIVAGGRDFNDKELLTKTLDGYLCGTRDKLVIISGHAKGADMLGEEYAKEHSLKLKIFPADWKSYGNQAGFLRNTQMARYASEDYNGTLIAFWDGKSNGTKHMIEEAKLHNMEIIIIDYDNEPHKRFQEELNNIMVTYELEENHASCYICNFENTYICHQHNKKECDKIDICRNVRKQEEEK